MSDDVMSPTTSPLGAWLGQDLAANRDTSARSRVVVVAFRGAQAAQRLPRPLGAVVDRLYQVVVEWLFGIELPSATTVGPGLTLQHGVGLVVNDRTVIGRDCTLRHGVTIGNKAGPEGSEACPVIGDGVDIGAHAVLIGPITVGDGATIGAAAVVVRDVPPGVVVVGNPARVVERAATGQS